MNRVSSALNAVFHSLTCAPTSPPPPPPPAPSPAPALAPFQSGSLGGPGMASVMAFLLPFLPLRRKGGRAVGRICWFNAWSFLSIYFSGFSVKLLLLVPLLAFRHYRRPSCLVHIIISVAIVVNTDIIISDWCRLPFPFSSLLYVKSLLRATYFHFKCYGNFYLVVEKFPRFWILRDRAFAYEEADSHLLSHYLVSLHLAIYLSI